MINPNLGGNGQGLHYGKRNQKGRKKTVLLFKNFYGLGKLFLSLLFFFFFSFSIFIIDFSELLLSSHFSSIDLFLSLLRES